MAEGGSEVIHVYRSVRVLDTWVSDGTNDRGQAYRKFHAEIRLRGNGRRGAQIVLSSKAVDLRDLPADGLVDIQASMEVSTFEGKNYFNVIDLKVTEA